MDSLLERVEALESGLRAEQSARRSVERQVRLWRGVAGVLVVVGLVSLPLAGKAQQRRGQGGIPELERRITVLEATVTRQAERIGGQASQIASLLSATASQAAQLGGLQGTSANQTSQIAALQTSLAAQTNQVAGLQATSSLHTAQISGIAGKVNLLDPAVTQLTNQTAALADKLVHFSRAGNDVFITGANLHLVNGLGATDKINGLGNLIIGYDEPFAKPEDGTNDRTGSHNVVAGVRNNFSSFGGFIAGTENWIAAPFASVTGGSNNVASGPASSVTGGLGNQATGDRSCVSGGGDNIASGPCATVTGGLSNAASGFTASVSGGSGNEASGSSASVAGGHNRTAANLFNWSAGALFQSE